MVRLILPLTNHGRMWYDRSKASMMIFMGAALAFIGIGLYIMGHMWPGVASMMVGMASVVIGFTILKFHIVSGFGKRP
ncbi:MAG: hypothetical protein FWD81_03285 [Methanomassiliicoccaceae archaeon]|nr:hypothetical protein [Methanomassiliicoccaceae archaeon]